jgi:glycerophosphoryl diester phosphodiesterase
VTTLRLAHRGDWRVAPENTIAAMQAALAIKGCDGLEFDVRASADGVPILLHDAGLERVQGVRAAASSLTAGQLAQLRVPTLSAVLAAVGRRSFLDVELKEWVPAVVGVLEAARAGPDGGLERTVISSFHDEILREVGRLRPGWPRWLNSWDLSAATIERVQGLGCEGIAAEWRAIDDRSAADVAQAGLELVGWMVRRRATFRRLERLGAVAICVEAAALDGK